MASEEKRHEKIAKEKKQEVKQEMTLEEAKAYRASLYKDAPNKLDEQQKREQFRLFWAEKKYQYGKTKDLEDILWLHLQASKLDDPESFDKGLANFGLKKIS